MAIGTAVGTAVGVAGVTAVATGVGTAVGARVANGDGVLEPGEVTQTKYVCNGAPGTNAGGAGGASGAAGAGSGSGGIGGSGSGTGGQGGIAIPLDGGAADAAGVDSPAPDAGTCNPSTGVCCNPNASDGTECNDGLACTTGDTCQAGVCTGTTIVCTASDTCHTAACDPSTGSCTSTQKGDGAVCITQTTSSTCTTAINQGIRWLATQQRSDGSWVDNFYYSLFSYSSSTALAVTVLENYAIQCGYSPFNASASGNCGNSTTPYVNYNAQIVKGLNYLFANMTTGSMSSLSCNTCAGGSGTLFDNGIVMMAIAAGSDPNQVVPNNSALYPVTHNQTYRAVETALAAYVANEQAPGGGWYYGRVCDQQRG